MVDDGGWPILIGAHGQRSLGGGRRARRQARRARRRCSAGRGQALEDAINNGRIAAVTARGFVEMKGALPIIVDGQVIGAIGVSADTPDHDVQIAQAGLAALSR